jgi:hypothetical protein
MTYIFSTTHLGDKKIGKNAQILEKVAKTVTKPKIAKISTTKLNLKVQNIYIKQLLKPKNTCNKPYFNTADLGENIKTLSKKWPKMS